MFLKLQFVKKKFFLKDSFKISRESKTIVKAIIIKLSQGYRSGFAECVPYKRYGESQFKIFNYLLEKKLEITQLIRQKRFKEIKYLSLRSALELAFTQLHSKNIIKHKLKSKYLTSITLPITNIKNGRICWRPAHPCWMWPAVAGGTWPGSADADTPSAVWISTRRLPLLTCRRPS